MIEFNRLLDLADDVALSCISTAEGVRNCLSVRAEVMALQGALKTGAITFEDVSTFVHGLIAPFVRGTRSPADVVLAAVVVAIEPLASASIEEFTEDLARVKVAEMPMSPRVARLSLGERRKRLAQITIRHLDIAGLVPLADGPREYYPTRIPSGLDFKTLDLGRAA